jgi:hypothetical protein
MYISQKKMAYTSDLYRYVKFMKTERGKRAIH